MHCIKKITEDLTWIGVDDRRLAMFEGVYSVPNGVSYNSYLLKDDRTVLFDTVDKAVVQRFFENLKYALDGKKLDYIIVQHMEPDHSAGLCGLLECYPDVKVVCNKKTSDFIKQFHEFDFDIDTRMQIVSEGDTLCTGRHTLHFVMAPMVHWPEVMVTYDSTDKVLFSADAFGCFGALNGAIFADEVDFARDYMDEARRYYTNIVGKYGSQVEALLGKAAALEINMICPLHGFVWRKRLNDFISKYKQWSSYEPEENGVMIAYASVYGNTENAAEMLSCKLRDRGIKTVMFDVSVTPASEIVAAAFKWSHLVFASTTYNAGIFVSMEAFLHDLISHNIQKRTVAIIENGSWAATSGKLIREKIESCKKMQILDNKVSIKSSLKAEQAAEIDAMADAIAQSMPKLPEVAPNAMFKIPCGLFALITKDENKDNGCIINTVMQITGNPKRIAIAVNKENYSHDMIVKTGGFNVCILDESAPFKVFEHFGFQSGRDTDKFADCSTNERTANGIRYLTKYTNAVISGKVIEKNDYGTHSLFIAEVGETLVFSNEPSVTYAYYFANIKPKPQPVKSSGSDGGSGSKKGYVCKICGYVYEGEPLPDDFICPLCKHGVVDFEPI
ncbi:MAG: flavin reductase [Oscillospiraceae bacterium]|nr:flavin reductase [Oscillospiraceae bacterium]